MPKYSDTDLIVNPDGSIYHLNLKPGDISDKIITVGDPSRVHRVSSHFDTIEFEMNKREFITHVGKYKDKRITVISTGMGTDNVEILMTELDALVNIDLKKREPKEKKTSLQIVRIGTSGSIQEDMRLGSHVLSEYGIGLDPMMHFYKLDMTEFELEVCHKLQKEIELPYLPYCIRASDKLIELFSDAFNIGNTVTCHGFYAPQGRELRIPIKYPNLIDQLTYFHHKELWLTNLEMETAGYYAMARMLGHEMISMNAIVANRVRERFSKDPNKVIDSLIKKVLERI
ncbi:nucleoside phosphorylase [Marinoscillum sp. MHG1-6]|uniref:nucleoside phosphorylase n=1 Tax=Marinoscillum sp. MHG1-6 TaxID=2959627 RepID=UPI002157CE3A|nr:nucleoside phosphorylase [Marinoscillum sp. MHG1-6]